MCISNTADMASCSPWTAFAAKKNWKMTAGIRVKTVYVWFRDPVGNTSATPVSDTIIVDKTPPTNGTVTVLQGDMKLTLNWDDFSDTDSGVARYRVVFKKGSVAPPCTSALVLYTGTDQTLEHTGLLNGTTYAYRVCAINGAGSMSSGVTKIGKPVPETVPPTGTVKINEDAGWTKSASVVLTLTATDASEPIKMCISNTTTCKAWKTFVPTKNTMKWKLAKGIGTKTVSVWFRDVWGNESATPVSDTIIVETTPPVGGTLAVKPGDGMNGLSWADFVDEQDGSGVGSYKVVFAKGKPPASCAKGTVVYEGALTSYTHNNLVNGTNYGYRVCAIDNAKNISSGVTTTGTPTP
jgi:hypothetical protein